MYSEVLRCTAFMRCDHVVCKLLLLNSCSSTPIRCTHAKGCNKEACWVLYSFLSASWTSLRKRLRFQMSGCEPTWTTRFYWLSAISYNSFGFLFERFSAIGLKINIGKCKLLCPEVL